MATSINPELKSISRYLKLDKNKYFVIPEYQRGYSWTISQCEKLWNDIESFVESDGDDNYFFGTVIIDCSHSNQLSLIDGQQRTTTFLLLLKALLLHINKIIPKIVDDEVLRGLKSGLEDRQKVIMSILYRAKPIDVVDMLENTEKIKNILILQNNSINELHHDELNKIIEAENFDIAQKNAFKIPRKQKDNQYTNHFRNFKFFYEQLADKSESQIYKFAEIFLDECEVIAIRSEQTEQAITMFNSLNSTGLPLSDSDIISAQLYANAKKDDMHEKFNENWADLNKLASRLNQSKIVNLDNILQQYMYIHRAIGNEYVKTKDDGGLSIDVTTPGLRRYYTEIKKDDLLTNPLELCQKLTDIANKWEKVQEYPIVKLMLKNNENIKLFLAGYLYRFDVDDISQENISTVCESLLRLFTLLEVGHLGYSSSKFKTFLFGEIVKLIDKNISIDEIKQNFDKHISQWQPEDVKILISDYDKNILVFLNEYLFAKQKDLPFDFVESVNIEHIMPASGRNIDTIRQDANIADIDEFKSLVNKIGNKILLEGDVNKSIGKDWFKTKKQNTIGDRKGYKDSKYAIAKSLVDYSKDQWEKDDILTATDEAVARISDFIFAKNK
ncbi:DUF262 domain-containing protein [Moraxella nonliquefaciens]|uniref:DUF262 domain-containing protein n=1 Tax=Moraxella nonliquefaciens TaxID=478 RepID=A0A1B8QMJ2_MORNO|nr:DUF262 domain-containing protein [Moraxella nonliquefaciens]OBX85077.1 hypothetical protein A7456_02730 [Moraxella nonliquefaciens]QPT45383.1 DUF262 domain-containing protein [Moraxella nonliquefaciens]QQC30415.1 DUF262 domain-containing protein [Moraxella nonliquefaciens]